MKMTSRLLLWAGFNFLQNLSCPYIYLARKKKKKKKKKKNNPGAGVITSAVIAQEIESIWYVSYLFLFRNLAGLANI